MHMTGISGISLRLPDSWSGYNRSEAGGIPVIHAGNFELPAGDDMPANLAQQKLAPGEVLITLWEYPRGRNQPTEMFTPLDVPLAIGPGDFGRYEGVHAPAYALRVFSLSGRLLQIGVAFGEENPTWKSITAVNAILGTLTAE